MIPEINSKYEFATYKIILLGESQVGKSSFLLRYVDNKFSSSIKSTSGIEFRIKKQKFKDKKFRLDIYDTGGQERYRSIANTYYKKSDVVIGIYSLDKPDSINQLINFWFGEARKNIK